MPPTVKRRLASMLYEGMLLFGVSFAATLVFSTAFEQRHALYLRQWLILWLFLVFGLYFVWCWMHKGQTLAMKTWKLRLVTVDGKEVGAGRAIVRYLLSWLWLLPGLALATFVEARMLKAALPLMNVFAWALTAYFDPQRQFLHDRLAGTRIVSLDETKISA